MSQLQFCASLRQLLVSLPQGQGHVCPGRFFHLLLGRLHQDLRLSCGIVDCLACVDLGLRHRCVRHDHLLLPLLACQLDVSKSSLADIHGRLVPVGAVDISKIQHQQSCKHVLFQVLPQKVFHHFRHCRTACLELPCREVSTCIANRGARGKSQNSFVALEVHVVQCESTHVRCFWNKQEVDD